MKRVLHILTSTPPPLALDIIRSQNANRDLEIVTVNLTDTDTDYDQLVDLIFASDSVQVW